MGRKAGIYIQVFETVQGMQISIDEVGPEGGTGYRIKGPKFGGTSSRQVLTHRLTAADINAIRDYLDKAEKYEQ